MGERCESRRSILLSTGRYLSGWGCHLVPLVLIVVTVETEQFPVASVRRIVIVVVVFVMNCELAQLFAIKFSSAMRTDPGKHFERLLSIGLLQLSLVSVCHVSLDVEDCTFRRGFSERCRLMRCPCNPRSSKFDRSPGRRSAAIRVVCRANRKPGWLV